MASLVSRTISKTPLPSRLPLLLVGSGLANLTLARTLQIHGYSDPDSHFRIFDQSSPHARRHQSLNLQTWATDPFDELLRRGKPHHGKHPGFFESCAVDAQHGGKGHVNIEISSLKTTQKVTELEEGRSVRYKRQELDDMIKGGVNVEHNKKFKRFEEVVDEEGRSAIRAFFEDGTSVLGSAIVAGDGMRSTVRSLVLPTITPEVHPLVVYTGQTDLLPRQIIGSNVRAVDNVMPAYHQRAPEKIDCHSVYVGNNVTFIFSKTYLDSDVARIQWTYVRKPKGYVETDEVVDGETERRLSVPEGVEEDPLYRPNRTAEEAKIIPDALYDEINDLKSTDVFHSDLLNLVQDVEEGTGIKNYHWLMRSVKFPKTKEKLDQLKAQVDGGEKVFFIGDAAHAAPIVQGTSGSHSLYDGYELGLLLSKAFRSQSLPSFPSSSLLPPSTPSSPYALAALDEFESNDTLDRWRTECVSKSVGDLMSLVQPQERWDAIGQKEGGSGGGGLTDEQKELRKKEEVVEMLEELAAWQVEQGEKVEEETKKKEEEQRKVEREKERNSELIE